MQRIEDMGLAETFRLIKKLPEGARRQQAMAHALDELLEEEVEYRTGLRHQNAGWHQVSSVGGMGEGRGDCMGHVDHVGKAAERYQQESQWRTMAAALLTVLNEREKMAVLLATYMVSPDGGSQSPRMMTRDRGILLQDMILQLLGWPPGIIDILRFPTVRALESVVYRAKKKVLYLIDNQACLM